MILGHSHEKVVQAIQAQAAEATSFGAPTELETRMAELIKSMVPNVDLIRMVSSGTEACMSAIRLARGFTGRNKLIKFDGCYHGHADMFLVKAGSGLATFNIQQVPGIPQAVSEDTLIAPYNNTVAVEELVAANPGQIAAIIIEPVAGNMGCIPPAPGFLEFLRTICDREGILLVFDEVMTGFRLAPGGAQERLGIKADLVTYGKVIGGGLPVGAFGGRREIMEHIAPLGKVYQAGTLSGNPIAMMAGYTTLSILHHEPQIYQQLEERTEYLHTGLREAARKANVPVTINRLGSMISLHFCTHAVTDFETAAAADIARFNQLFHFMLDGGIYLPPSAFETWFISHAVTVADIDRTVECFAAFCREYGGDGTSR
jgi:glutamate-1-semialdehyde 2,1-aminomutase